MADAIADREGFKTGGKSGAGDDEDEEDLPCLVAAHKHIEDHSWPTVRERCQRGEAVWSHLRGSSTTPSGRKAISPPPPLPASFTHVFFDRTPGASTEADATSASVQTPAEVVMALQSCVGDLLRLLLDDPLRAEEEDALSLLLSLHRRRRGGGGLSVSIPVSGDATATTHNQDGWLLAERVMERVVTSWFRDRFAYKGVVRPTDVVGQQTIAVGGPTPSYNLWPDADVTEALFLSILLVPNVCLSAGGSIAATGFLERVPGVLRAHGIDTARFVTEEGYRSHFAWIMAAMTERQVATYVRVNPRVPCAHQRVGVMLRRPLGPTMHPHLSAGPTILHPAEQEQLADDHRSAYCVITLG
jgi:hypothetical protein